MPLTVSTSVNPATGPVLDSPSRIAQQAQTIGISAPAGRTIVGLTVPSIRTDQTQLQFETRNHDSEFRFNTGTLRLTLSQEIHLSSDLNSCAQAIWLQHEQRHVRDNQNLMSRMDQELRADSQFAAILVNPTTWRPRAQFHATQQTVLDRVAAVFRRLCQAAVLALDTAQEYDNVEGQVRDRCSGS